MRLAEHVLLKLFSKYPLCSTPAFKCDTIKCNDIQYNPTQLNEINTKDWKDMSKPERPREKSRHVSRQVITLYHTQVNALGYGTEKKRMLQPQVFKDLSTTE